MSDKTVEVIVVDAGNTRIKVAAFKNGKIDALVFFQVSDSRAFERFVRDHKNPPVFVSSVLSDFDLNEFFGAKITYSLLNKNLKMSIDIRYGTSETLGLDRLANAEAIQNLQPDGDKVSIDLGTCMKFDFVNSKGHYLGGSISPGLRMRYEALHHFTGKLPLLETKKEVSLIGTNSHDSIHSGVINGMKGELVQFINRYSQEYQGLTFFVTGGDMKYFELDSKNNIFAHENLTLFGLYYIYQKNA
jgi:type III pantothenate kinase